jgi:redox-sensitive bicupin YhaK (pirin superfamily)
MTAGRGIVHSERTPSEDRAAGARTHGIQTWAALPKINEQIEPGFSHHPKNVLPHMTETGIEMFLIVGTAFGEKAPTPAFSDMFYVTVEMDPGARLDLPPEHEERGVYVVEGEVTVADQPIPMRHLATIVQSKTVAIRATTRARVMLIGGARMDGDRFIWWNFVASSKELIEEAKICWRAQRFPSVPGETEFIPLPER